jgi:hypothetical protein
MNAFRKKGMSESGLSFFFQEQCLFPSLKTTYKLPLMIKLFTILLVCALCPVLAFAQGDLLVTPSRVVFEGNKQKESLNLLNMGKDSATYTISFIQYNMKEDGSFVVIDKPDSGQWFADPFLRIFPRTVTLAPGEPQVIMLQCRRSPDMIAGEYRSHIYFRSEKNNKPVGLEDVNSDTTLLSVKLIPVYGISIPVIIRTGLVNVNASLSDLRLDNRNTTDHFITLTINRTGNISIYGDVSIEYIPEKGKPIVIGMVKGVGVYTNINQRKISVKLNVTDESILTSGKIRVQYKSNGTSKPLVYAEAEMVL